MMRFPRTKFVDENTLFEQCTKIHDEVYEVFDELTKPRIDYHKAAQESWDVIAATETKLRMLQETFGVDIEAAKADVIERCSQRGYYS